MGRPSRKSATVKPPKKYSTLEALRALQAQMRWPAPQPGMTDAQIAAATILDGRVRFLEEKSLSLRAQALMDEVAALAVASPGDTALNLIARVISHVGMVLMRREIALDPEGRKMAEAAGRLLEVDVKELRTALHHLEKAVKRRQPFELAAALPFLPGIDQAESAERLLNWVAGEIYFITTGRHRGSRDALTRDGTHASVSADESPVPDRCLPPGWVWDDEYPAVEESLRFKFAAGRLISGVQLATGLRLHHHCG